MILLRCYHLGCHLGMRGVGVIALPGEVTEVL
jgi:hypothetical protein